MKASQFDISVRCEIKREWRAIVERFMKLILFMKKWFS